MLERVITEDALFRALTLYMDTHKYGNAISEALWHSIDKSLQGAVSPFPSHPLGKATKPGAGGGSDERETTALLPQRPCLLLLCWLPGMSVVRYTCTHARTRTRTHTYERTAS